MSKTTSVDRIVANVLKYISLIQCKIKINCIWLVSFVDTRLKYVLQKINKDKSIQLAFIQLQMRLISSRMIFIHNQSSPKSLAQNTAHHRTLSQYRATVECYPSTNIAQLLQISSKWTPSIKKTLRKVLNVSV